MKTMINNGKRKGENSQIECDDRLRNRLVFLGESNVDEEQRKREQNLQFFSFSFPEGDFSSEQIQWEILF